MLSRPVHSTASSASDTTRRVPAWLLTQLARRYQPPTRLGGVLAAARDERPEQPRPEQREQRRQGAAARTLPRRAVPMRLARQAAGATATTASSSVSSASTTVALLATIAGPAWRTAVRSAARWFGSSGQFLAVTGDQQQCVVGARAEHQHAGDAGGRAVGGQPRQAAATTPPSTVGDRSASAITSSGTSHRIGDR